MVCSKGVNLNKENSDVCGDKGGKCEFLYSYSIDKCLVSNKANYLELTNVSGRNSMVQYAGGNLTLGSGNVRIYSPAIHNVVGSRSVIGEVVMHYVKNDGGDLFVCIPIKQDDTSRLNNFWSFLDTVKDKSDSSKSDIKTNDFTLNKIVTSCPFFRYKGKNPIKLKNKCSDNGEVLVWDSTNSNIATISSNYKNKLYSLINQQKFDYSESISGLLYNKHGAMKPGEGPDSGSTVEILSNCTKVDIPKAAEKKTKEAMQNWIWITPLILLGVFAFIAICFFFYNSWNSAWLAQRVGSAARGTGIQVGENKGIAVLSTLLVGIIVCIVILFVRQG